MSKDRFPVTPAIRALRHAGIVFTLHQFTYEEHGGTTAAAAALGEEEHRVIKTIVLVDDAGQGLVVLMHGDHEISTRNLARQIGRKHIEPASAAQASKWTGYQFGGTSPFGMKTPLPVFVQSSILNLDYFWINGGKRGLQARITPADLAILNPTPVDVAIQ